MSKLTGRKEVKGFVESILDNGDTYRLGKVKVPSVCMNVGEGEGQSAIIEYIADAMYDNHILPMHALDRILEFRPDTTTASLIEMENIIRDAAVYTNDYEGIVAIDISNVASSDDRILQQRLVNIISKVSKKAMVIIFINDDSNELKSQTMSAIGRCVDIRVKPLSPAELAEIAIRSVEMRGINTIYREELTDFLHCIIERSHIKTAKLAEEFSDSLLFCCDYTSRTIDMAKVYSTFGGKTNEK